MIPANIDQVRLIKDLNEWGLNDYKVKEILGFSEGYVAQLKCNNITQMSQQKAARLYNFWWEERRLHDPLGFDQMVIGEIVSRLPYLSVVARLQILTHGTTT